MKTFFFSFLICSSIFSHDFTWNGGGGYWNDIHNWTPAGYPTSEDTATFNSGYAYVTLDGAKTVRAMTCNFGSSTSAITISGQTYFFCP
ncbi:MAG: hypothetical protein WCP39_02760, partial [Chlamydiota bacterium]